MAERPDPSGAAPRHALLRNSLWNFVGVALPMVLALGLFPVLIGRLGTDRFGLLAIIWGGIGYFSLFDLGLGRALTHQVSARIAQGRVDSVPALVRSGATALLTLGAVAGALVAAGAPWLVGSIFAVPADQYGEALGSFLMLAVSLPAVLLSAGLIGVLEGQQRFRAIALIRIPLGASSFVLPALLSLFTLSLEVLTLGLVVARLCALAVLAAVFRDALFHGRGGRGAAREHVRQLLKYGGWVTVSNVVGPVLVYFDRFFIGAIAGLSAVGFYVTPHEIVSRLTVVPQAIVSALFPAMTAEASRPGGRLEELARSAGRVMTLIMLPMTLFVALFAGELLAWWIDAEFARGSAAVAQILAAGTIVNTFARVPFIALQSAGRADLTAKIHLVELLPYLAVLAWAVREYGVIGAAAVWLGRVAVDTWLLCGAMAHVTPVLARCARNNAALATLAGPGLLLAARVESFAARVFILVVVMLLGAVGLLREIRPLVPPMGVRP